MDWIFGLKRRRKGNVIARNEPVVSGPSRAIAFCSESHCKRRLFGVV